MAVIGLGEPVFGAILGFVILAEVPAALVLVGSIVVLAGMYLFSIHTEEKDTGNVGS